MMHPPQRVSFITLGVSDLLAAKHFYQEKFGWQPLENESDGIVFFQLNGLNNGAGFRRFTLAINCYSEQEVNDLFEGFRNRGVNIVKAPEKVFWGGYSGYIKDIDDNLWEIAYNPFIPLDNTGNIVSPTG
jgi:predicted lactoylglutathione lyase